MPTRVVMTIGNFDGVHRGHAALLHRAREVAAERDAQVVAMTLHPHPAEVLRPDAVPPSLTTISQRIEMLREAGAHRVDVAEPTPGLLEQSPQQFLERLCWRHDVTAFVEGADFHFGRGRKGDIALLREIGEQRGFDVIVPDPVEVALTDHTIVQVRSSLIRWLVACGRVQDAAACLGRFFALRSKVVRGEQRGRSLGVPTVNLSTGDLKTHVLPAEGVYAGIAELRDGSTAPAAISIGVKPTFRHDQLTVEAHLLDRSGNLYGQRMTLRFARWLRDQQAFPGVEALRAQLSRDVAMVRKLHEMGLLEAAPSGEVTPVAASA